MTQKFPELKGDSLPAPRFGGAWIVQRVTGGYVFMLSADMKSTLRLSVDRFNWFWDQFQKATQCQ